MLTLDDDLTPDERAVRDTIHRFALEVLRPAGHRLDALPDPAQVIAPDSVLWDVFARHRALGLDALSGPESGLDPVGQARMRAIVAEEMGWGDAGLAISLGAGGMPRAVARLTGTPEVLARFDRADEVGCWTATEPDHGSDMLVYGARMHEFPGEPNCVARPDGDGFVINGQKAAWVSNGTIATATLLLCVFDDGSGVRKLGAFLVPLDVPGVSRGKPLDKLGQRALNQGEVFFDDVRIPAAYMLASPEASGVAFDVILSSANSGMGCTFAGVARAAFELALDYAKERRQGGMPIIRHQSVRSRLFEMFRKVEAARALARRALVHNATNVPRLELAVASKVTATQTAFEVASAAVQLFGGNGLSREYPVEKLLRDARASMIEDGCNEVLGLLAAERF